MKAFELALKQRSDGLELDVFLTADQKVVVTHDRDTKRLTGQSLDVCLNSYDKLRTLDFGEGEKLPLLADVLDLIYKSDTLLNIEIKSMGLGSNGIESRIVDLVLSFTDLLPRILVSSFNPLHLWRTRRRDHRFALGYLACEEQSSWVRLPWLVKKFKPQTLNLNHKFALTADGQKLLNLNHPLLVWTVNDERDMNFWIEHKADGIITNYPDRLLKLKNPQ